MNRRWKMNRIGFVNFWLYDEEVFEFENGKLLLRGQNGSGKSITTQSFIPFILDGDRTPSRLDPFGSSDRRMEYYFLGEEGKEEATGYLFLEFRKEQSAEYRTLCIGQRARRGKPMDFWGFVLLDGRRIGFDFPLYREVGSTRLPYDKREMRQLVGEKNAFTDMPGEYKKFVNQYIFGFRKMEQYEQFIRLLVKVRAPKLSKEFKPTKVYEILNDSLQTLTDEDLRPMVDAMEKMDEIQASLERLERAFADVRIIRTEYTRYNQFMLGKKGQAFLRKRAEAEKSGSELKELGEKKRVIEARRKEAAEQLDRNAERVRLCTAERDSLLDSDIEEMDRKLEDARRAKAEAETQELRWSEKAEAVRDRLRLREETLRGLKNEMEMFRDRILKRKRVLAEYQETLQWERHPRAVRALEDESPDAVGDILSELRGFKKAVENCLLALREYEEAQRRYDEAAEALQNARKTEEMLRLEREHCRKERRDRTDRWITDLFRAAENSVEWHPPREVLDAAAGEAEECVSLEELGSRISAVETILRTDYERQRDLLAAEVNAVRHRAGLTREELEKTQNALEEVSAREELDPVRDPDAEKTRRILEEKGIPALPFFRTVEFAPGMDDGACARLEAQLEKTGLLDALVVSEKDLTRIRRELPEFLDTVLSVPGEPAEAGGRKTLFPGLLPGEDLPDDIRDMTERILRNMAARTEEDDEGMPAASFSPGAVFGVDGTFRHGMLAGRADKTGPAEYVGRLARARKRAQEIARLSLLAEELRRRAEELAGEEAAIAGRMEVLTAEYRGYPDFSEIRAALEAEHKLSWDLDRAEEICRDREKKEQDCEELRNSHYRNILKLTRPYPYGRTREAYQEVLDAAGDYQEELAGCEKELGKLDFCRMRAQTEEEERGRDAEAADEALYERRRMETRIREEEIRIRSFEEYLNRPEIVEKTRRLEELKREVRELVAEAEKLRGELSKAAGKLEEIGEREPELRAAYSRLLLEEQRVGKYFEEELALGLVLAGSGEDTVFSAQEAMKKLRESDRGREATEMLGALNSVYQKYNGSLVNYGTSLEECFGGTDGDAGGALTEGETVLSGALRKRVRVVSVWNGKKVYLEEFYGILRDAIAETEQLIRKKDRELFEDILSQTISRQLTDRIDASRGWVRDMSSLMQHMDTSMGLRFSLDWKPCRAENEAELDTSELEQILLRSRELLSAEDIGRVASHFRSKIRTEKQKSEEEGGAVNYMEMVRDALDYRRWFEFRMYFRRGEDAKKPLTNAAFNRLSGGEKAMAMYVPLFAAVNAQYRKAEDPSHPRIIALDEAFAGVDDRNIGSMFELVEQMDFDYIMNSQALWGCYDVVPGLRIAELLRPANSSIVTIIRYKWNGRERELDEQ